MPAETLFLGPIQELADAIDAARASATRQTEHESLSCLPQVFDAIRAAVISIETQDYLLSADESERFISSIRDAAILFLNGPPMTREQFKTRVIGYLEQLGYRPRVPSLQLAHYRRIASVVLKGSSLHLALASQTEESLAAQLHKRLGPDFLRKVTDPTERAQKVFNAAGLPRDFMRGAEYQRAHRAKVKATKASADPASDAPARVKRRRV